MAAVVACCSVDKQRLESVVMDLHATLLGAVKEFDILFPGNGTQGGGLDALLSVTKDMWDIWKTFHHDETLQHVRAPPPACRAARSAGLLVLRAS